MQLLERYFNERDKLHEHISTKCLSILFTVQDLERVHQPITSVAAGIYGRNMWLQSGCFPRLKLGSFRVAENIFMHLREARSFQKLEKALCKTLPLAVMCLS